jgi:LacI family transcriptional regulator
VILDAAFSAAIPTPCYNSHMPETRKIGLAVDAVASYGRGIIRGIMAFSRANPHWIITVEPLWSFGTLPDIQDWDVDGLIVQTFSKAFEDRVLSYGRPATNVSNFTHDAVDLPTIIPDDRAVGCMAAEYLLSIGLRELGFCRGGIAPFGQLRLEAFRERAAEAGISVHEYNNVEQDLGQWVADLPKPIGVLGCNDDWAHRVLNFARRRGIQVPDEMAVIGVDDDELFNTLVTPSLSSIALPAEQIGYEAASQLDRIMNGEKLPYGPTLVPPLRVVPRESTDMLTIADQDVVVALRFIRQKAAFPLQVEDVMEHVPLSQRSLQRRFKQFVGHSIKDAIRHAHIDIAKKLLTTTDLSMPQIAKASGFNSATRLGIIFQQELKESPTHYRRRSRIGKIQKKQAEGRR